MGTFLQNSRMVASKLLILPIIVLALFTSHIYVEEGVIDISLETIGFFMLLTSALGRIWASAHISGKKTRELVTDGPYSVTRNPLYFFSFLGFAGAGLAFESLTLTAFLIGVFYLLHWPTILAEEANLRKIFGATFDRYTQSVPRFFPKTWKVEYTESVQFSPKAFSRSIIECGLVAAVFIAAHLVEWGHLEGILPVLMKVP